MPLAHARLAPLGSRRRGPPLDQRRVARRFGGPAAVGSLADDGPLVAERVVAAVFAVHPLHVESVAWVTERKDVLSGLFFMLTLWRPTLGYVRRPFSLGSLSGRAGLLHRWPGGQADGGHPAVSAPAVGLLAAGAAAEKRRESGGAAGEGETQLHPRSAQLALSPAPRSPILFGSHLGKGPHAGDCRPFLPVDRPRPGSRPLEVNQTVFPGLADRQRNDFLRLLLGQVLLSRGYCGTCIRRRETCCRLAGRRIVPAFGRQSRRWPLLLATKRPYLLVGWLWYLGMMVPVIGLLQIGTGNGADRFTYLPQIGLGDRAACGP